LATLVGIVVATLVLLGAAYSIVTPRKSVAGTLDEICNRIEANDEPGVVSYISPAAKQVRADAESLMSLVVVDRARITATPEISVDMGASPPTAEVRGQAMVNVTVKENGIKGPYLDHVQIHFVRSGDRWLIESYTPEHDWRREAGKGR
jgi:hypothetical protein